MAEWFDLKLPNLVCIFLGPEKGFAVAFIALEKTEALKMNSMNKQ